MLRSVMSLPVTTLYAAILGLLFSTLSIRVPMQRGRLGVPYGDGDDEELGTRIRAFGNLAEYAPLFLVQLALLEVASVGSVWLHTLGVTFTSARLLHATVYRAKQELTLQQKVGRGVAAMTGWLAISAESVLLAVQAW